MSKQIFDAMFTKGLLCNLSEESTLNTYGEAVIKLVMLSNRTINFPRLTSLLEKIPKRDIEKVIMVSFYIRCPRGGRGNRDTGRSIFQWLFINYPEEFLEYIDYLPEKGRWDDIFFLFPGALRLGSLDFVNRNYCCNITKKVLKKVKQAQEKVVKYVAEKFLEYFHIFMDGGRGFELFVKWLPSEKSALNKKYKIVETLCDELNISLKDYRVIYVTPMRNASDICENSMCRGEWSSVRYEKISKKRIKYYKNAFGRHDSKRFSKWRRKIKGNYFAKPHVIIDNYLDQILENDRKRENAILESSWQKTIKLVLDYSNSDLMVITDTSGCMYKKIDKYRIISYAISLSIISACQRPISKYNISMFCKTGFTTLALTSNLMNTISRFRLTFTNKIDLKSLVNLVHGKGHKTALYITCSPEIDTSNVSECDTKIIIWHITSRNLNYKKLRDNIYLLSGFTSEIFRYFLVTGDFNPYETVNNIIGAYSK